MKHISDDDWLKANLAPEAHRASLGIPIPDLPPDQIQLRFTGRTGRENLRQAFDFYKFVLAHLPEGVPGRLLDFGGGWGRLLRFFLREFPPERLLLVDVDSEAIDYARKLRPPFEIIHNQISPPLPLPVHSISTAFAFSVFSHLSESQCAGWFRHFAELLSPGGKLFVTTRGKAQIDYLESLGQQNTPHLPASLLPPAADIRRGYERGVFQFYPTGDGAELTGEVYGETWIPKEWMEERYAALGFRAYEFYPEFETVDQCVFVLTK